MLKVFLFLPAFLALEASGASAEPLEAAGVTHETIVEAAQPRILGDLSVAPVVIALHSNYIRTDDGAVDTPVGWYGDFSGESPLGSNMAYIDGPISQYVGGLYFVGHNPGVFAGLFAQRIGSTLTYFDGNGAAHRYRIVSIIDRSGDGDPTPLRGADIELQTCVTLSGSIVRVLSATEIK